MPLSRLINEPFRTLLESRNQVGQWAALEASPGPTGAPAEEPGLHRPDGNAAP
jgi:hypothetical protein